MDEPPATASLPRRRAIKTGWPARRVFGPEDHASYLEVPWQAPLSVNRSSPNASDRFWSVVDNVRTHGVLDPCAHRAPLVPDLMLEDGDHAAPRRQHTVELFLKSSLASLEVVVEIREHGVKRYLEWIRTIPVVHMWFEALARSVSVEAQTLVESYK